MSHQCAICYNDFSCDPSAKDKSNLPVQSRVCSHVLCYSCMMAIYQASNRYDEVTQIACPECRLKGAHDPFVPIISLPMCELLSERNQMVQQDPTLKQVSQEIRKEHLEQRRLSSSSRLNQSASELLVQVVQEKAQSVRRSVRDALTVERPSVRLLKEASRAFYWGSILMFGTIDRNETAIVEEKSVEKVWNKMSESVTEITEKLEEPLQFTVENPFG